jgi:hypothetical protein
MDNSDQPANIEALFSGSRVERPGPNAPSDALLAEMARIRALPGPERNEALEPHLERWHARHAGPLEIAWYLAAAGLNFDEACVLDHSVRTRASDELRVRARHDVIRGVALLVVGLLTFAGGSFLDPHFPVWGVVLLMALFAGGRLLMRGLRTQRRITPLSDEAF